MGTWGSPHEVVSDLLPCDIEPCDEVRVGRLTYAIKIHAETGEAEVLLEVGRALALLESDAESRASALDGESSPP
jgi:hypothetical protein